jgi:hypothetical protein
VIPDRKATPGVGEAPAASTNPDEKNSGKVNDLIINADAQVPSVVIGIDADKNNPVKLERIEVMLESDERLRIMVRARRRSSIGRLAAHRWL